jgi:biopolymer transport protein ExbD
MTRRRRRKKHSLEGVELNLTAMLDMAFQLLAFFVLTFKPAPQEGEISLRLPPPQPVVSANAKEKQAGDSNKDILTGLTSLTISIYGDKSGGRGTMQVNDQLIGSLVGLDTELKRLLSSDNSPFEQVLIQVGSDVRYNALMSVVDVCTRQKLANGQPLAKLSFVELPKEAPQ